MHYIHGGRMIREMKHGVHTTVALGLGFMGHGYREAITLISGIDNSTGLPMITMYTELGKIEISNVSSGHTELRRIRRLVSDNPNVHIALRVDEHMLCSNPEVVVAVGPFFLALPQQAGKTKNPALLAQCAPQLLCRPSSFSELSDPLNSTRITSWISPPAHDATGIRVPS